MKENHAWIEMVILQVFPRSQVIFPFKTWFFGIYLNFQWQKSHFKIFFQYLPHSESKSYQINSVKIFLIKIFPSKHQKHFPIPLKFSAPI
jgi:hypothetical protein